MNKNNIKTIMWDYGGVLTDSPIKNFKRFEKNYKLPINTIIKINSSNPLNNAWAKFEKDIISLSEFIRLYKLEAASLGLNNIDPKGLLKCLDVSLNKKMFEFLKSLLKDYDCICLTNNFKYNISDSNSNNFNSIKKSFKYIFESSKLNMRKPEKKIYNYVLDNLNLKAEEILFIDDLGINLKPARELGFHTYKFTDTNNTISFIKNMLKI